jgi:secreted Zn-dependent insulinase-like peptidase
MATVKSILAKLSIESLYHGNFDQADVNAAKNVILEATTGMQAMQKKHVPKQEVLIIPRNVSQKLIVPSIDPKEPNTAVEVYFQCGKDDINDRVVTDLLTQLMYEPLYDQLRTKEQFGYQ